MRGKLQQADGGTCSSTRSATCRWRCKPACCGCWKTAGGADRRRAAGGGRAHHQRHPPRFAGAGGRQFPRRPVLPPQWPGSALPALRERSDKSQLLDFCWPKRPAGRRVDERRRQALLDFAWPGNVRQMRNVLRTLAALCDDGRSAWRICPRRFARPRRNRWPRPCPWSRRWRTPNAWRCSLRWSNALAHDPDRRAVGGQPQHPLQKAAPARHRPRLPMIGSYS
jgi:hypothetical protein